MRRLNIDVDRIVSIHGRVVPYSELLAAIGKKPAPAKNNLPQARWGVPVACG